MPNPVLRVFLCVAAGLLLACTGRAAPMGEADARHLLNRTGFGAPPQQVASYAKLSREQAVERLLAGARSAPVLKPPSLVHEPLFRMPELGEEEKKAVQRAAFEKGVELRAWWLQEMLQTPSPLSERMTLFWHNHFVSSQQKVKSGKLMLDQNLLLAMPSATSANCCTPSPRTRR